MCIIFAVFWSSVLSGAVMGAGVGWTYGVPYAFVGLLVGLVVGSLFGSVGSMALVVPVLLILSTPYAVEIENLTLARVPSWWLRASYAALYALSCLFLISASLAIVGGANFASYRCVSWLITWWRS
jgi:hypothetical protein